MIENASIFLEAFFMAETHVVSALMDKRAEILGEIEFRHKEIARLTQDLTHLESTLSIFSPNISIATQKPKEYRMRLSPFKHGELPILIMEMLRLSEKPMATNEIAYKLAENRGLPTDKDYDRVVKPVHSVLQRMRRSGVVCHVGRVVGAGGGAILWKLVV